MAVVLEIGLQRGHILTRLKRRRGSWNTSGNFHMLKMLSPEPIPAVDLRDDWYGRGVAGFPSVKHRSQGPRAVCQPDSGMLFGSVSSSECSKFSLCKNSIAKYFFFLSSRSGITNEWIGDRRDGKVFRECALYFGGRVRGKL